MSRSWAGSRLVPCLINNSNICAGIVVIVIVVEVVVVVFVIVAVEEDLFFGFLNPGPTEGDAEPPHHFHLE